jgi:hypothetical protein
LNDVAYVEAARVLAERVLNVVTGPAERIDLLFRFATARHPTDPERRLLTNRLEELLKQYGSSLESVERLMKVGDRPSNPRLDAVELAAYTGVASVVLNLDEVLCKE